MFQPNRLLLPASLECPSPPRLRLNYKDIGTWEELELLAVHARALTAFRWLDPMLSRTDISQAIAALKDGRIPDAEVPRLGGTVQQPALASRMSLMQALFQLGYEWLPVIATKEAAEWLRQTVDAKPAGETWRVVAE